MSTPSCSSVKYVKADLGGMDVDEEVVASVDVDADDVDWDGSDPGGDESDVGGKRAEGGTDFRASAKTSTVSRRSDAKRVMAKSRCCSFSRAALR
jgi:hypothetical protein